MFFFKKTFLLTSIYLFVAQIKCFANIVVNSNTNDLKKVSDKVILKGK